MKEAPPTPTAQREPGQARCRLCGVPLPEPFLKIDEEFSLARCESCGLVETVPPVPPSEIGRYYPPNYYGEGNRRFNALFEALIPWFRDRRGKAIERFLSRGKILDVGCGRGILPALMRDRGWDAHGLEFSETAAQHARQLGIPVFVGSFLESPYDDKSFDAIVLWHVLEHVPDPLATLERARQVLRPGGLLVIAVPNFESLQARFSGRHWFHLDVPRHYHHFGLSILNRTLKSAGFSILDVSHLSLEYNPYGWIQSIFNRIGFRFNLLYDLLKNPSARSLRSPLRSAPLQTLLTLALLPPVVSASFALTLLEILLRRGGTIEVYARRDP
jgi:2-polyprenyl-3-methyl-5-hydroxy-6-metoxy-1,4-benzoquinol methylase